MDREEHFVRPPGARPEAEFLALCIRCHKCRDACRYAEIVPVSITESIINAGTPKLENGTWCPNCRRCIPVCPTGALLNTIR
jgi:ferredoxin